MNYYGYIFKRESDLTHYGVLGMKWGVRKNPQKAYTKANKKLHSLRGKSVALNLKAQKKKARVYRRWSDPETYSRKLHRISLMEVKSEKYAKRAERWSKQMDKVFATIPLSQIDSYIKQGS